MIYENKNKSTFLNKAMKTTINVSKIVQFVFKKFASGEIDEYGAHNFWEMVYVEEGQLVEISGEETHQLSAGDVLFHKPNVFHRTINPSHTKIKAYNIPFQCPSRAMDFFKDYKGTLSVASQQIARLLVEEGKRSFVPYSTPKGDNTIAVKKDAPIGGQQMYRIYLEELLINILREQSSLQPLPVFASKDDFQKKLCEQIIEYLKKNLYGSLTLEDLQRQFSYSNTFLCTKFKEQAGESIMQCYNRLKIEEACKLMQRSACSLAEISVQLGFNNPYYFSRVFKRVRGTAPSEYRRHETGI